MALCVSGFIKFGAGAGAGGRFASAAEAAGTARISNNNGRIDASFYCTHLASENHPDRKPGTGMGLKAKATFPEIDFSKSVMVGDSASDMEFGKKLGMLTVLITDEDIKDELVDFCFDSLRNFANQCGQPMTT